MGHNMFRPWRDSKLLGGMYGIVAQGSGPFSLGKDAGK